MLKTSVFLRMILAAIFVIYLTTPYALFAQMQETTDDQTTLSALVAAQNLLIPPDTLFTHLSNGESAGRLGFLGTGPMSFIVGTETNNSMVFQTNSTNRMTIKNTGNIGIGTTEPTTALELGINKSLRLSTNKSTMNNKGLIQLQFTGPEAKATIEYYDENNKSVVWLQTHNYLSYPSNRHKHFSIETADLSGFKQTRLGVEYGCDYDCKVQINQANLVLSRNSNQKNGNFYIHGGTLFHTEAFKLHPRYAQNGSIYLNIDTGPENSMKIWAAGADNILFEDSVTTGPGRVIGVGNTSPEKDLDVLSESTATLKLDSSNPERGSCIIMKDSDGEGYTYLTVNNGVPSFSTAGCQ